VLVDGKGIGDIGSVVLRDRQLLAQDGVIAVSLTVDRAGALVAGPQIASRGVVYVKENEPLLDELKAVILRTVMETDTEAAFDREVLAARVRATVRQFVNQRFHRKPVVLPMILEA
jgi:ribonuclease J